MKLYTVELIIVELLLIIGLAFSVGAWYKAYTLESKMTALKAEASKKYCAGEITYKQMTGGN